LLEEHSLSEAAQAKLIPITALLPPLGVSICCRTLQLKAGSSRLEKINPEDCVYNEILNRVTAEIGWNRC